MPAVVTPAPVGPLKSISGWRTFLFNGAVAVAVGIIAYIQAHGSEVVPPAYWPFVVMAVNAINTWLRSITNKPVG